MTPPTCRRPRTPPTSATACAWPSKWVAASAPAACLTASRSVGDVRGTDLFVVSAGQPFLWLNELGHRYIWEDLGTQSMTLVVRANMAQKKAFSIFDSEEFGAGKGAFARNIKGKIGMKVRTPR